MDKSVRELMEATETTDLVATSDASGELVRQHGCPGGNSRSSTREDRLRAALDVAPRLGGFVKAKQRTAGLRLVADDLGWSHGDGPPQSTHGGLTTLDGVPDLVLIRHGESTWNAQNLFTGWTDVDLTPKGEAEARQAGALLAAEERNGLGLQVVHTSVLTRAVRSANLALDELGRSWLPVRRHWRLNERHYGDLQGLNKKQTTAEFGEEKVRLWRRSYDVPPPALSRDDERHPIHDHRYRDLPPGVLPDTECLADVVLRMVPYWEDAIAADLRAFSGVLVVAHGNSIRALVKYLKDIPDDEITGLEIPTGVPWWFRFDDHLELVEDKLLGDPEAIRAAAEAVARQAG